MSIQSKLPSPEYDEGWDRIYNSKKINIEKVDSGWVCMVCGTKLKELDDPCSCKCIYAYREDAFDTLFKEGE